MKESTTAHLELMFARRQAEAERKRAEQKERARIANNKRRREKRRCKCGMCRTCKQKQWRAAHPDNVKAWVERTKAKQAAWRAEPYIWPEPDETLKTMFPNYYAELYSILRVCGLT